MLAPSPGSGAVQQLHQASDGLGAGDVALLRLNVDAVP